MDESAPNPQVIDNAFPFKDPQLRKNWRGLVSHYAQSDWRRSVWQLVNTLVPYFILLGLMVWSLQYSYWLTLALAVPAAAFLMRIFIIFHDCGHGSFFKSQRANAVTGYLTGILTFTAYHYWTRDHAIHHATAGDLDRRGVGDVDTLTVEEYLALPAWRRLAYRVMRQPFFLLVIGAPVVFLFAHRFYRKGVGRRERNSVLWTNLALLGIILISSLTIGLKAYLMVQLPIIWLASMGGVWLFYVQHQFEGVYWRRHEQWDYLESALMGASFYKLPRILQWFTGSIGFHHLHHLAPRIPNYNLEKCHADNPVFQGVKTLTLLSSMRSLRLRLYDEERGRLIGFRELKLLREAEALAKG
jgi:acyl-lipid omega-6 desaturase (Delta-12 desaturase)